MLQLCAAVDAAHDVLSPDERAALTSLTVSSQRPSNLAAPASSSVLREFWACEFAGCAWAESMLVDQRQRLATDDGGDGRGRLGGDGGSCDGSGGGGVGSSGDACGSRGCEHDTSVSQVAIVGASRRRVAPGGEFTWGAGFCGSVPWFAMGVDAPAAEGSSDGGGASADSASGGNVPAAVTSSGGSGDKSVTASPTKGGTGSRELVARSAAKPSGVLATSAVSPAGSSAASTGSSVPASASSAALSALAADARDGGRASSGGAATPSTSDAKAGAAAAQPVKDGHGGRRRGARVGASSDDGVDDGGGGDEDDDDDALSGDDISMSIKLLAQLQKQRQRARAGNPSGSYSLDAGSATSASPAGSVVDGGAAGGASGSAGAAAPQFLCGEVVFVPETDRGHSFLTPALQADQARGAGGAWRWRHANVADIVEYCNRDGGSLDGLPSDAPSHRSSASVVTSPPPSQLPEDGKRPIRLTRGLNGDELFVSMQSTSSPSVSASGTVSSPASTATVAPSGGTGGVGTSTATSTGTLTPASQSRVPERALRVVYKTTLGRAVGGGGGSPGSALGGGVRSLAVGGRCESLLACGGVGEVSLLALDDRALDAHCAADGASPGGAATAQPVTTLDVSSLHPVVSELLWLGDGGQHLAALGGGISLWDVETSRCVLAHESPTSLLVAMAPACLPAVFWSPVWELQYGSAAADTPCVFVASSTSVAVVDMRARYGAARVVADWTVDGGRAAVEAAYAGGDFGGIQSVMSTGNHVVVGSSSGCGALCGSHCLLLRRAASQWLPRCVCAHIRARVCTAVHACHGRCCVAAAVLDARMGRVLRCWQAHDAPVVRAFALSSDSILTVSAGHTALVWDINQSRSEAAVTSRAAAPAPLVTRPGPPPPASPPVHVVDLQHPKGHARTMTSLPPLPTSSAQQSRRLSLRGSAGGPASVTSSPPPPMNPVPPPPPPPPLPPARADAGDVTPVRSAASRLLLHRACPYTPSRRVSGVLGTSGCVVALWRQQGVSAAALRRGATMLLSADGDCVGVSPIRAQYGDGAGSRGSVGDADHGRVDHTGLWSLPAGVSSHVGDAAGDAAARVAVGTPSGAVAATPQLPSGGAATTVASRIKCLAVLPLRRALVVASDDGTIRVCA